MDEDILAILRREGRIPVADLARRTGLSYSTARDRLRRLEEAGVIRGYTTALSSAALGLGVHAWVVLDVGGDHERVCREVRPDPAVERIYSIVTQPSQLLALVHAADGAALARVLDRWSATGASLVDIHLVNEEEGQPSAAREEVLRLLRWAPPGEEVEEMEAE